MQFSTPVSIQAQPFDLSYRHRIVLAGSCFADEIGSRLVDNRFSAELNPFGTLYNPASVESSLLRLLEPLPFTASDLFFHDEMYHSFAHHSSFSSASEDEALAIMNQRLTKASLQLKEASRLIVTWGTAFVYRLKATGDIVANCHKLPDSAFVRKRLSVDDIVDSWETLLGRLWKQNPDLRLIITVSPIRHWKDGAQGNQLSKAILMLAADRLQQSHPDHIACFPAYEIMMDELRDYRFYAADMLHPSVTAVEYIWERFRQTFFKADTEELYSLWQPVRKALNHAVINPDSESYRRFIAQTLLKAKNISAQYPFFDLSGDISLLESKL